MSFGSGAGPATFSVIPSMRAMALSLEKRPRGDVDPENEERDERGTFPREPVAVLGGAHRELEDDNGKIGHRPAHVRGPELVVERRAKKGRCLAGVQGDRVLHAG